MAFLPGEYRLIRRDGIRLFNIHYWANVLSPLAGRSKELALIKYDPRNLSRVFWEDKQGHYWPVPYRDLRLPLISLWEHRQAVRELRAQGRRSVDQATIFAAILGQRKILNSIRKPTSGQRQEQARRGRVRNAGPFELNVGAQDPAPELVETGAMIAQELFNEMGLAPSQWLQIRRRPGIRSRGG